MRRDGKARDKASMMLPCTGASSATPRETLRARVYHRTGESLYSAELGFKAKHLQRKYAGRGGMQPIEKLALLSSVSPASNFQVHIYISGFPVTRISSQA